MFFCAEIRKLMYTSVNSDIFHISAQNIDCRYPLELPQRGGSNEYPQSMFLRRNKKNNVYPCKPQFYYIKAGFVGINIIHVFVMPKSVSIPLKLRVKVSEYLGYLRQHALINQFHYCFNY